MEAMLGGENLDRYYITMGDFLKNAGIIGLQYLLETAGFLKDEVCGISEDEQEFWLDRTFASQADWTGFYIQACVKLFGPTTTYQRIMSKIQLCIKKLKEDLWTCGDEEKEDIKFINEKLFSASYQSGYDIIKGQVSHPETYINLKENKLTEKMDPKMLLDKLTDLECFLGQKECHDIFIMKSVIYTYINRFWNGKCFLLRTNTKKNIRELYEKDFSKPFRDFLLTEHKNTKDYCMDCGEPIHAKERISMAFMNEMGDDFARKKSAFWNCKVDAYLCPGCAFLYSLVPLGFQLFADKFVFINMNSSIPALFAANSKSRKEVVTTERKEEQKYNQWFAQIMNTLLKEKAAEILNIQVVIRGLSSEDRYQFDILSKTILDLLKEPGVVRTLEWLGNYPSLRVKSGFLNVHETVVGNLLKHKSQYGLLDVLMKAVILDDVKAAFHINCVYQIQLHTLVIYKSEKERGVIMQSFSMRKSGAELRQAIMYAKNDSTGESLRGIEYQLLNALSVRNTEKFMDIIARLYSAYGTKKTENGKQLLIPQGMIAMVNDPEKFVVNGYAFVMGLIGCSEGKKGAETWKEMD